MEKIILGFFLVIAIIGGIYTGWNFDEIKGSYIKKAKEEIKSIVNEDNRKEIEALKLEIEKLKKVGDE